MLRHASAGKTLLLWWASLALITLLWDAGGLDLAVSAWFGDASGFALREHAVWGRGMYQVQRVLGWSALAVLLWLTLRPRGSWVLLSRRERWAMLITVLAVVSLIPLLKKINTTSCPWDLAQFGGAAKAQWVSHWNWGVMDTGARRCFPAGHSSTALGFLTVPVFLLNVSRPWALRLLALVAVAGLWMGFTQVYRGAHYVSHTLWTATISLSIAIAVRTAMATWLKKS
jgi:membrane-associated PAP2 superfamily phosphatase